MTSTKPPPKLEKIDPPKIVVSPEVLAKCPGVLDLEDKKFDTLKKAYALLLAQYRGCQVRHSFLRDALENYNKNNK